MKNETTQTNARELARRNEMSWVDKALLKELITCRHFGRYEQTLNAIDAIEMSAVNIVNGLWSVAPLSGKYYGTVVCYDGEEVFKIWQPDHFAVPFASEREILDGWTPEDGHDHVEDQQSYRLAVRLVEFLNQTGFELK